MNFEDMTFGEDDLFDRKPLADKIADLIGLSESLREDSFVIALNASWGNGKTTFVKKLINEIKEPKEEIYSKLNAIPIYYNAWEEDDYGNAFESLIYRIVEEIGEYIKKVEEKNDEIIKIEPTFKEQWNILKIFLPEIIFNFGINHAKNIGIELEKVNDEQKSLVEKRYFEKYQEFKKIKKKFKEILKELASKLKIIVFIDELDRCRPDFAIETLEIVKHYFNISNIVFVLSLDIEQLSHSIATCYGQNMDSAGYLRRFIDFQVNIPQSKLNGELLKGFESNDKKLVLEIFNHFNLSIRDFFKVSKDLLFFYNKTNANNFKREINSIYINLIIIKYLFPNELKKLLYEYIPQNDEDGIELFRKIVFPQNVDYFEELKNGVNKTPLYMIERNYNTNNKKSFFIISKLANDENTLGQHIERVLEYVKIS